MSNVKNTLKPISGVSDGDEVSISVRRNGENDKTLTWKESEESWFVEDKVGDKRIEGRRGLEEKSSDFSISDSDQDKVFVIDTGTGGQVNVTLPGNFNENEKVTIVNSGEGVVKLVGSSLSSALLENQFLETGRTDLYYIGGNWQASFKTTVGTVRSEGFIDQFTLPTNNDFEEGNGYIVNGLEVPSQNALWLVVRNGSVDNFFSALKYIRYDLSQNQVTDEFTQVDGTDFQAAGYVWTDTPLFLRNGNVWSVSVPYEFGSSLSPNLKVVKFAADGSSVESFPVPSSVANQASYRFSTQSHTYNSPREIGKIILTTAGGSIVSFDLDQESWQYEFDRLNDSPNRNTYDWHSAYVPSKDELWVNYYGDIEVFSRNQSTGKFDTFKTTYEISEQTSIGSTDAGFEPTGEIFYDSENDRVVLFDWTREEDEGENRSLVFEVDTDGTVQDFKNLNNQTGVTEGLINTYNILEKEGDPVVVLKHFDPDTNNNLGLVYYDYTEGLATYSSFDDRIVKSFPNASPGDLLFADQAGSQNYLLEKLDNEAVYLSEPRNGGSSGAVQSFELSEDPVSFFEQFEEVQVSGNLLVGGEVRSKDLAAVSLPAGADLSGFRLTNGDGSTLEVESPQNKTIFRLPEDEPARFTNGINTSYPFRIDPDRVQPLASSGEVDPDITKTGETIGYSFDLENSPVAKVVADYRGESANLGNVRFKVTNALSAVDSENNKFFETRVRARPISESPTLSKTEATSGNLDGSTSIDYAVVARDPDGNRTLRSPVATIDSVDPSVLDSNNFITVDWQSAQGNLGDYVVLKDEGQTGTFVQVGTPVPSGTTTFDDTGQSTSSFTQPSQNETAVTSLGVNNTADTSGDIQIRDDSTGDLFSLDDGGDPQFAARYEGSQAFTIGYRAGENGTGSLVLGGADPSAAASVGPNYAPAQLSIAIGTDNQSGVESPQGTFPTEFLSGLAVGYRNKVENEFSFSIGGANSLGSDYQVVSSESGNSGALGYGNSIEGEGPSYALGVNNSVGTEAENAYLFGSDLLWGDSDGGNQPTTVVGSGNEDIASSTNDIAFVVGTGNDNVRRNGLFIQRVGQADEAVVTQTDNIYLSVDPADTWSNLRGGGNVVSNSSPQSGQNPFVLDNLIFSSTVGARNLSDSIVLSSELVSEGVTQGGDGSIFVNATINPQTTASEVYEAAFVHSTRIGQDSGGSNDNSDKFHPSSGGIGPINAFTFNDDTILAYQATDANNQREGSLVLAGEGSVSSPINDVQNSVSIRGAQMNAASSVGIGNTTVSSTETLKSAYKTIVDVSSSSAFSVQDGSGGNVFTVDSQTGDAKVEQSGQGVVLTSPDGTQTKRVFLDNSGNLATETV